MTTFLWPVLMVMLLFMPAPAVSAGEISLPSPTKRTIIVHGPFGEIHRGAIDADTAALLDEAARTAAGDDNVVIVLNPVPESTGMDPEPVRTYCQAEAMLAYLVDQGVAPSRVRVSEGAELHPLLMSRSTCEGGAVLHHLAN